MVLIGERSPSDLLHLLGETNSPPSVFAVVYAEMARAREPPSLKKSKNNQPPRR